MATIVTRAGKGSPLTHNEVDANFNNLNTDKLEKSSNLSDLANTATARTNLLPSYTGNAGKILAVNTGATDVEWVAAGSGSGTVTSVDMSVPTGFAISGNPVTTSGTLALSFASGYSLPTTTKQGQWDTAYSWGNHATAGYLTTAVTSALAGTGISVSSATGAVTFTNTAPDQTVVLTAGTGVSISGTYPNFTITNTGR